MTSKPKSPNFLSPAFPSRRCSQLANDCSRLATHFGFDFLSGPGPDGLILLAAKPVAAERGTLAFAEPPPVDWLGQVLCRYYKTLGCDGVIFVCPDRQSLNRLSSCLQRAAPPEWTDRVGFTTQGALRILAANSGPNPSLPAQRPARNLRLRSGRARRYDESKNSK